MRIVVDARMAQYERTGIGVYVQSLLEGLIDTHPEHTYVLIVAKSLPLPPLGRTERVEFVRCAPGYGQHIARDIWEQGLLPDLLHRLAASVYHSPNYILPVVRRLPCPSVVTLHDPSLFTVPEAYKRVSAVRTRFLIRRSAKRASALVFDSRFTKGQFARFIGSAAVAKGTVIYLGLPREFKEGGPIPDAHVSNRSDARPYVISVGAVHPRKNYERLFEAMKNPALSHLDLKIVGGMAWKTRDIVEAPARLGIAERVEFTGYLPTPDLQRLMRGAAALVLPSVYEGFGIPILEGFAARIPVCASNNTSYPEIGGQGAVYFDPYSSDAIADALVVAVSDPCRRGQMMAAGAKRLEAFTWADCAERHIRTYEKAVRGTS